VGFFGTIPGAIAGTILGRFLKRWTFGEGSWTILGACAGALVLANVEDADRAL
jgi:outer membrane lipoprotein SlyB